VPYCRELPVGSTGVPASDRQDQVGATSTEAFGRAKPNAPIQIDHHVVRMRVDQCCKRVRVSRAQHKPCAHPLDPLAHSRVIRCTTVAIRVHATAKLGQHLLPGTQGPLWQALVANSTMSRERKPALEPTGGQPLLLRIADCRLPLTSAENTQRHSTRPAVSKGVLIHYRRSCDRQRVHACTHRGGTA
jgi:hypothetical protein